MYILCASVHPKRESDLFLSNAVATSYEESKAPYIHTSILPTQAFKFITMNHSEVTYVTRVDDGEALASNSHILNERYPLYFYFVNTLLTAHLLTYSTYRSARRLRANAKERWNR